MYNLRMSSTASTTEAVDGRIERATFHNPDNGLAILAHPIGVRYRIGVRLSAIRHMYFAADIWITADTRDWSGPDAQVTRCSSDRGANVGCTSHFFRQACGVRLVMTGRKTSLVKCPRHQGADAGWDWPNRGLHRVRRTHIVSSPQTELKERDTSKINSNRSVRRARPSCQ